MCKLGVACTLGVLHTTIGPCHTRDPKVMFGQALKKSVATDIFKKKLADIMQMHRNTVALLERGERNPSLETIRKLAKALNVSAGKFFERF